MNNCMEGFLCDQCNGCVFWKDGSENEYGCFYPGDILHCLPFADEFKKWEESLNVSDNERTV